MKTDPASSTRSNKKGLNDNNNRLLGIVNKFCIPFGTKSKIVICGFPGCREIEHRGPGSIVFRKFFLQKRFRSGLLH